MDAKVKDLTMEGGIMHARISRWVVGTSLSFAVAAGGAMLGALPAQGQSITGLGQADQVFNVCYYTTFSDDRSCGDHDHERGGGSGRGK
jgi:hypothetical protein